MGWCMSRKFDIYLKNLTGLTSDLTFLAATEQRPRRKISVAKKWPENSKTK